MAPQQLKQQASVSARAASVTEPLKRLRRGTQQQTSGSTPATRNRANPSYQEVRKSGNTATETQLQSSAVMKTLVLKKMDEIAFEVTYDDMDEEKQVAKILSGKENFTLGDNPFQGARYIEWLLPTRRKVTAEDGSSRSEYDMRGDFLKITRATVLIKDVGPVSITVRSDTPLSTASAPTSPTATINVVNGIVVPAGKSKMLDVTPKSTGQYGMMVRNTPSIAYGGTENSTAGGIVATLARLVISRAHLSGCGDRVTDEDLSLTVAFKLSIRVYYESTTAHDLAAMDPRNGFTPFFNFFLSTNNYIDWGQVNPQPPVAFIWGETAPVDFTSAKAGVGYFLGTMSLPGSVDPLHKTAATPYLTFARGGLKDGEPSYDHTGGLDPAFVYLVMTNTLLVASTDEVVPVKYLSYEKKSAAWYMFTSFFQACRPDSTNAVRCKTNASSVLFQGDEIKPVAFFSSSNVIVGGSKKVMQKAHRSHYTPMQHAALRDIQTRTPRVKAFTVTENVGYRVTGPLDFITKGFGAVTTVLGVAKNVAGEVNALVSNVLGAF